MNLQEKMDRLLELVAEINKLADEIEADRCKVESDDILAEYKNDFDNTDFRYYLDELGEVCHTDEDCVPTFKEADNYMYYHLFNYAAYAQKLKRFNDLLLAFKYSHEIGYEPDWGNFKRLKFFVDYNANTNQWEDDCTTDYKWATIFFDSADDARLCAEWLNKIDPKGELLP